MSDAALAKLAQAAGIGVTWTDAYGQPRSVADETLHSLLDAMQLPSHSAENRAASLRLIEERTQALPALITADAGEVFALPPAIRGTAAIAAYDEEGKDQALALPGHGQCRAPKKYGYYQLVVGPRQLILAVAPPRCFGVGDALGLPPHPTGLHKTWGLVAQVYALRHAQDGGVGDSRAMAELAQAIGQAGGDALALSPLHAVSPIRAHYSPYSPSHRGFFNWLHADAAQVLGAPALLEAIEQSGATAAWQAAQHGKLVDWPTVYALRRKVFGQLHALFAHAPPDLRDDLQRFATEGGAALRRHAWFAARQAQAARRDEAGAWQQWNEDWHDEAVAKQFAREHGADVEFEMFLQWLSARSWEKTAALARDAGQRIGLIHDLAVGFETGGSEAWAWREHVLAGLELGAPPDAFNPQGQSWGVTAYAPWGLQATGFRPFIELLRANMAHGGGIRIDHIIGFQHLWVLRQGQSSAEGGYLRQPLQDLLRLTALESWRQRCIVIGEDLGTVPAGLRDILAARGVLGIDVLLFTHDEQGEFLPPHAWRKNAVAMTTTHDLPPLAGWRQGTDLRARANAQAWREEALGQQLQAREQEVAQLDATLAAASPSGYAGFLANTPAPLVLIPLEDALERTEQPNLPGTVDSHPNWRHRLPDDAVETLPPVLRNIDTQMKQALPA
ncbi:MAG TPA: 4-alpha-glucanotransferase [Dyella sp.]|uniref:4-alpha-glucanotransferase n=1 Tax=Dyella sp. TaxID=1869338 RepID=UPI002CD341A7|nr:4-alpha-glucanotransferase [Dyella sp.]HUB89666.1 4-alpha-glucanotransferase [Dyella sp.]